jgi:uncharacterized protein (DUF1501 family)
MNHDPLSAFTRRQFLARGLTLASASLTVPWFVSRSAFALPHAALGLASMAGVDEGRILVVIQLSGGNDGLNTVVPIGMPEYYRARPGIGIGEKVALSLNGGPKRTKNDDGLGLHPSMQGIKQLYDEGQCSIIQGVGYPNPNRSHFKSMDIWHTADTSGTGDGWLGRYFDAQCCGFGKGEGGQAEAQAKSPDTSNAPGIALGRTAPLAMQGQKIKPIAFESEDLFRWIGQDVNKGLAKPYQSLIERGGDAGVDTGAPPDSNAAFLMRTALDARVSSDLIRKAVRRKPEVQYNMTNPLAQQLSMIASMIAAGLPTRVYYAQLGGFDTHAGQGGQYGNHAGLLERFSSAVRTFYQDLKKLGVDERVLTMSFSEFGRRVAQNNSQGTDHGTAAPMFLFGPMVNPGVLTAHPSLKELDEGDLKYTTDFRMVYAGVLKHWLAADDKAVLERSFEAAPVIKRS